MMRSDPTGDGGSRRRILEAATLVALVVFAVAIRIPSLSEPIGSDQAIQALIARELKQGAVLYRDVWEQHTPLAFYIEALFQQVFGATTHTVHLLYLMSTVMNVLALYGLGKALHGSASALLGSGLYALFSGSVAFNRDLVGTWTMQAKPEGLSVLPLVVGIYALIRACEEEGKRPWLRWTTSGLAFGLAIALKPSNVPFLIGALVVLLVAGWRRYREARFNLILFSLLLVAASASAQLVYLVPLAFQGTLSEFWRAVVLYNLGPYSELGLSSTRLLIVSTVVVKETLALCVLAIVGCAFIAVRDRRLANWIVLGWGMLALAILVVQDRYYSYQYLPLVPPLCLLAAYAVTRMWRNITFRPTRFVSWTFRAAALALILGSVARFALTNSLYYSRYFDLASGRTDTHAYEAAFSTYPRHYSFPADKAVAEYVRSMTDEREPLGTIGGYGATPTFLADRPPASRYLFSYQLFHKQIADHPLIREMRSEFLQDLMKSQPPFVLLFQPLTDFERFSALHEWFVSSYATDREFADGRTLYRRVAKN